MKRTRTSHYLVLVIRGLEFLAIEEIKTKLNNVSITTLTPQEQETRQGAAGIGKLLVSTSDGPGALDGLRSIQCFMAYLSHSDSIHTLDDVASLVSSANWSDALALWAAHRPASSALALDRLVFRGSAVRDGTHTFKSTAIAGEIGYTVGTMYPKWRVNLSTYDLEVVALMIQSHLVLGLAISSKRPFKSRLPSEERPDLIGFSRISTLRPSTAYMMLQLAAIEPGHVVLDAMCGVATIPIQTAAVHRSILAWGGDLDGEAMIEAQLNVASSERAVELCQWDAQRLPLRTDSIDRLVIDMPFGLRCGTYRHNAKLIPKVLQELERVMRPNGVAVLLVMTKKIVKGFMRRPHTRWRIQAEYEVNIGGLGAAIFVLAKV